MIAKVSRVKVTIVMIGVMMMTATMVKVTMVKITIRIMIGRLFWVMMLAYWQW